VTIIAAFDVTPAGPAVRMVASGAFRRKPETEEE